MRYKSNSQGFSLAEMMVVIGIMILIMSISFFNFRSTARNKSARNQVAREIMSDLTNLRSRALSGSPFNDQPVCGYGLHFINQTSYLIYAKSPQGDTCPATGVSRNYTDSDLVVERKVIRNTLFVVSSGSTALITQSPKDVFFEPPHPTVYIDNYKDLNGPGSAQAYYIHLPEQANCASSTECTVIKVLTSSAIFLEN